MTREQLAHQLSNKDWREDGIFPTDDVIELAKQNNLFILYGWSDDLLQLDGIISDEKDCYGITKKTVYINGKGFCNKKNADIKVTAYFCKNDSNYDWEFESDCVNTSFDLCDSQNESKSKCLIFNLPA